MANIKEYSDFLKKAAVLRYKSYKEWHAEAISEEPHSNRYIPDEAWREEYTRQSLNWASQLKEYLEELEPELQDTPLPDGFFDLKNANAIKVLVAYVTRRPVRDNLAGLARLYHYAHAVLQQEIKKLFRELLPLEASLSLLAASKGRELGPKELLHDLVQEALNSKDISPEDLAKILPYLELKEQVSLLKQYSSQPERVSELFHQLRKDRHEVTCFIAVAHILSPQDLEYLAKELKWSQRHKDQLQPLVSPGAWAALLETKSLKANHKIDIIQLLGDRVQIKERDLMHRIASEFCQGKKEIKGNTLNLLVTLSKSGILQEQDLAEQQKEALLKLAMVEKFEPIIIEILKALLKNSRGEANVSPFLLQLSKRLLKPGGEQVINDVWLPYVPSLQEHQIKTLITELPGIELTKALKEELIRRNLSHTGRLPTDVQWQTLDLDATAGFIQDAFLKTVEVVINLTCTLNELAYRHLPTKDWLNQLPEDHQVIFNALISMPLQELSRKSEGICHNGIERMNKEWEKIWNEINTFAREVEARHQVGDETDEISRYLRRYLQGYLTAINKLETVMRGELEQHVRALQEAIEIEESPFMRYQKIKFRYSILQSYLESLEESIIKDVGRHTHNQFEDFFIYLSDAGIPEIFFDQMYLGLLTSLGLAPVETRRGARVKFVPERHRHLRLESPEDCIIYTYGVIYRDSIICRATVV